MVTYKDIKRFIKAFVVYYRECKKNPDSSVRIFNSMNYRPKNYTIGDTDNTTHWLYRFVKENGIRFTSKNDISFIGVQGHPLAFWLNRSKHKVFFTVENVHEKMSPWLRYEHQFLNSKRVELSLGFDYLDRKDYLRFPFWVTTVCEPTDTVEIIREKCERINTMNRENRKRFAAFICRVDYFGERAKLADILEQVEKVSYPSAFRHNDDTLKMQYGDNKGDYLKNFVFNLCPENTNAEGYVTEKLFDAIESGCIPVYWGSNNRPEPEIINQDAVLFLQLDGDNVKTLELIRMIWEDSEYRKAFIDQPIFTSQAPEKIYGYLNALKVKLIEMAKA